MPRALLLALAALGALLTLTVVGGAFTVDEANYLSTLAALRQGRLTVPGTEGLPPSAELLWFDPQAHVRRVEATPVAPTAPPLYAPLALPFSLAGWRGLVALQTLSYLATIALVFAYARRDRDDAAGWTAAAVFALGGYSLDYAQGVWPHMLSVALATGAALLAVRVRDGQRWLWAAAAGLLIGVATGVRYQNVVFAFGLGLGVFLFAPRRWAASLAYGGGFALPLAVSSAINRLRLGSWNPVSKGAHYFSVSGQGGEGGGSLGEAMVMAWARVVDYAQRPPLAGVASAYLSPHPESGAYVLGGVVKKAWLQSSPWLVLALAALLAAWLGARGGGRGPAAALRRRELRALSLIVFGVLAAFALAGATRTDGWSYNQRYFLELVPLAAVAFAWTLGEAARRWRAMALGGLGGVLLAAAVLVRSPAAPTRHLAILYLPLALAALLLLVALVPLVARRRNVNRALALTAGLALGWALGIHLGEDWTASRAIRARHQQRFATVDPLVPEGSALLAFWGNKDAFAPWFLGRDVVVVDPFADRGETAGELTTALLASGRRVFVLAPFPRPILDSAVGDRRLRVIDAGLAEIEVAAGEAPR
jgi:4-amino-4-deoxy-L-arabinose transferase-like glycosyltransferase